MRRLLSALLALLTTIVVTATSAIAQVPEHDLKAAFIYNFVQFTQWPEGSIRGSKINLCASPGSLLYMALQGLTGKTVHGKAIAILPLAGSTPGDCQVVIATGNDHPQASQIRKLTEGPVLSITDDPELLRDGRMVIGLAVESGRVTFIIDNTRAIEGRLVVSSRLLRLAKGVR